MSKKGTIVGKMSEEDKEDLRNLIFEVGRVAVLKALYKMQREEEEAHAAAKKKIAAKKKKKGKTK